MFQEDAQPLPILDQGFQWPDPGVLAGILFGILFQLLPRQIKECVDLSGQFLMRLVEGLGLFTQPPAGLTVFEPLFVQMEQFPIAVQPGIPLGLKGLVSIDTTDNVPACMYPTYGQEYPPAQ